jgi:hypothetical protein
MPLLLQTTLLLICSNVFMTFAWYAHLKDMSGRPWFIAALVSWGVALAEYPSAGSSEPDRLYDDEPRAAEYPAGGDRTLRVRAVRSALHEAASMNPPYKYVRIVTTVGEPPRTSHFIGAHTHDP